MSSFFLSKALELLVFVRGKVVRYFPYHVPVSSRSKLRELMSSSVTQMDFFACAVALGKDIDGVNKQKK